MGTQTMRSHGGVGDSSLINIPSLSYSMNLDELFTSVRTMEAGGSTDVGNDVQNLNLECCFNRQSNFSLSQDLSKKTV